MAQIINFPTKKVQHSNAYDNLARLIAVAATTDVLNAYMETICDMEDGGYLLEGEPEELVEKGREKRIDLAKPAMQEPQEVTGSGVYSYTPEMGQQKPECQMEASLSYYGKHYYVDTPLELKGRGIKLIKQYAEKDFINRDNHKVGWFEYQVTSLAFEKLKEKYSISMERCLD